jgi:hypothetical protein
LSEFCHRPWRYAEEGADFHGRFRPVVRRSSVAAPARTGCAYNILVTGIGDTGVITIGALLGMAAHLDGRGCSALDFTGLSQKNGAVMSHVRIAPAPEDIATVRIRPAVPTSFSAAISWFPPTPRH